MTEYEFVVADKEDPDCRREGFLGEICCACRIYDISWDITDCDDHEQFEVVVNFLYENTSDSFSISFQPIKKLSRQKSGSKTMFTHLKNALLIFLSFLI